jgi:hypothetical protein
MKTLQCHKELNVRTSHAFAVQADWLHIGVGPPLDLGPTQSGPSGNGGSMIDTAPVIHNDPVTVIC